MENNEEVATICIVCGRRLKNPKWRKLKMGKVCYEKYHTNNNLKTLFPKYKIK